MLDGAIQEPYGLVPYPCIRKNRLMEHAKTENIQSSAQRRLREPIAKKMAPLFREEEPS